MVKFFCFWLCVFVFVLVFFVFFGCAFLCFFSFFVWFLVGFWSFLGKIPNKKGLCGSTQLACYTRTFRLTLDPSSGICSSLLFCSAGIIGS